jgi:hypothetical protein
MADYKVKIKTPSGQFRDCIIRDFVYSQDAERAALSQTGGGKVWSVAPYFDKPGLKIGWDDEEVSSSNESYNHSQSNENWDTSDWWDDDGNLTSEGKLSQFIIFTIIPSLFLFAIHPIVSILWNVLFSKMWFGWKFWFE